MKCLTYMWNLQVCSGFIQRMRYFFIITVGLNIEMQKFGLFYQIQIAVGLLLIMFMGILFESFISSSFSTNPINRFIFKIVSLMNQSFASLISPFLLQFSLGYVLLIFVVMTYFIELGVIYIYSFFKQLVKNYFHEILVILIIS